MNTPNRKIAFAALACVAALTLISIPAAVAADGNGKLDPAVAAAAKELVAVTKVKELIEPSITQVKGMQENMLAQQSDLSEKQKAEAKKVLSVSMAEVEEVLAWKNLEPTMVRVYASVFSEAELKRLSVLFSTPDGKLYIDKQLALQNSMMGEMSKVMMEMMPKIQAKTQAVIEKMKAEKQ